MTATDSFSIAQLYFKYAYGIQNRPGIQSFVHAAPYLCCVVSCLWVPSARRASCHFANGTRMTHWLNNRFGRKWTVFLTCAISCGSCVWQAFPHTWKHMFAARFILGLYTSEARCKFFWRILNISRLRDWAEECYYSNLGS